VLADAFAQDLERDLALLERFDAYLWNRWLERSADTEGVGAN
jgi:hypothetical protein